MVLRHLLSLFQLCFHSLFHVVLVCLSIVNICVCNTDNVLLSDLGKYITSLSEFLILCLLITDNRRYYSLREL
jgi:hypothetical protein